MSIYEKSSLICAISAIAISIFIPLLQLLNKKMNPDDDAGFRALTAHLRAAFPDVLPYGGQFVPVPHLTLDAVHDQVTEASTASSVRHLLPVSDRARHLDLAWYEPGRCRLLGRWELGTGRRLV